MSDLRAEVTERRAETVTARVWIAGDYDAARAFTRQWCAERGACWSLSPADYIYTGGEERGLVATLIHYPRFPRTLPSVEIPDEAREFGEALMRALGQASFTMEAPDATVFVSRRQRDAP